MKLFAGPSRRILAATALASAAIMLPVAAIAAPGDAAAPARPLAAAHLRECVHLEVWLGLGIGSAGAGTVTYPLEFSNVGHRACRLRGFTRVVATKNGHRIGRAATHPASRRTITLQPGATAHALLGITDVRITPACGIVKADGLNVSPPGEGPVPIDGFAFTTCRHKTRILDVGVVRHHVGIPAFTTP